MISLDPIRNYAERTVILGLFDIVRELLQTADLTGIAAAIAGLSPVCYYAKHVRDIAAWGQNERYDSYGT